MDGPYEPDGRFSDARKAEREAERTARRARLMEEFAARSRAAARIHVVFTILTAAAVIQAYVHTWDVIAIGIAGVVGAVLYMIVSPLAEVVPETVKFLPYSAFTNWLMDCATAPLTNGITTYLIALGALDFATSGHLIYGAMIAIAGLIGCFFTWHDNEEEEKRARKALAR